LVLETIWERNQKAWVSVIISHNIKDQKTVYFFENQKYIFIVIFYYLIFIALKKIHFEGYRFGVGYQRWEQLEKKRIHKV